jgi:hypothetical protein
MGQFSVEKPVAPGSVLSGNQHNRALMLIGFARWRKSGSTAGAGPKVVRQG